MDKDLLLTRDEIQKIKDKSNLADMVDNILKGQIAKVQSHYAEAGKGLELTDEEIIGDFCKPCDYFNDGCWERGQQNTCTSYNEALRQKKQTTKAQLTKVLPIMEARQNKAVRAERERIVKIIEDHQVEVGYFENEGEWHTFNWWKDVKGGQIDGK